MVGPAPYSGGGTTRPTSSETPFEFLAPNDEPVGDTLILAPWLDNNFPELFGKHENYLSGVTGKHRMNELNIAKGTTDPRVEFILPK